MRKWKLFQYSGEIRAFEMDQTIIPYLGSEPAPKLICNVVEEIEVPKIGESVSKTKRVEIEVKRRDCTLDYRRELFIAPVVFGDELDLLKNLKADASIKITFDIPIPERKVEITESEFDQAYYDIRNDPNLKGKSYLLTEELKKRFFGPESK